MARPRKPKDELQDAEIRLKVTDQAKREFIEAAARDGMDEVSVWFKWLGTRRVREQDRESFD